MILIKAEMDSLHVLVGFTAEMIRNNDDDEKDDDDDVRLSLQQE